MNSGEAGAGIAGEARVSTCASCKYRSTVAGSGQTVCMRYPPVMVPFVSTGFSMGTSTQAKSLLTVTSDEWWCGEFAQKADT